MYQVSNTWYGYTSYTRCLIQGNRECDTGNMYRYQIHGMWYGYPVSKMWYEHQLPGMSPLCHGKYRVSNTRYRVYGTGNIHQVSSIWYGYASRGLTQRYEHQVPRVSPLRHGEHSFQAQVPKQLEHAVFLGSVEHHGVAHLDSREVLLGRNSKQRKER